MSVPGTGVSISYNTDGIINSFGYPNYLYQQSDLQAYFTTALGVTTKLVLNSDYTLTGIVDSAGAYPGGVSLLPMGGLSPLAAGGIIFMTRKTQRTQLTQYIDNNKFPASSHEHALDKLTLMEQEQADANFLGYLPTHPKNITNFSGVFVQGNFYLNSLPVTGGPEGWVAVANGVDGTIFRGKGLVNEV